MDSFDPMSLGKVVSGQLTCMTGLVNYEFESGLVIYDDTYQQTCDFGQTECYKRTIFARIENWPGNIYFL